MSRIYLDHAATTPVREAALEAFVSQAKRNGNASALHSAGRSVKFQVEDARDQLAATLDADPTEVLFTAGGTEADNLALKGLYWANQPNDVIVATGVEHPAVLETLEWLEAHENASLVFVDVTEEGFIDVAAFQTALEKYAGRIALATLMWANNEIGTIQPVEHVAELCQAAGVDFHVDAVQAFGSLPITFAPGMTTMALSGHKIGAPVGIGALLVRRDAKPVPVLHGGGQEREIRSGTIADALIVAFAAAAVEATQNLTAESSRLAGLRDQLIEAVQEHIPTAKLQGPTDPNYRLPTNVHFSFAGAEGDSLLFGLDMAGIESSTGSACNAGVSRPSHVILATGQDEPAARSTQRFSLGHTTTQEDIDSVIAALPGIYRAAADAGMAAEKSSIRTANSHR
ncbi:cysteine desulfurase family protein [Yaniella halotolerans]|uniref:cysteine desulfurase family protein n=1 Tax=Yaniella halotolerans TaxID=225453 RepID=UPI0003B72D97|nr:cysteine desulfurase family protein [Yaniella halotolerans]